MTSTTAGADGSMTIEELDDLYGQANRLIMGRSVSAAGKALFFSSSSLDTAAEEIADLYGLTSEERAALRQIGQGTTLLAVQDTAAGLLGAGATMNAKKAVTIAKTAIDGGRKMKAIAALLKAGPTAAETVAAGGKVASRASVWGWVATAAYAAGTGSWFAYNLRSLNLAAYEARRVREGLDAHPAGPTIKDMAAAGLASAMTVATDGAKAVGIGMGTTAGAAVAGVVRGGGWLRGVANGLARRLPGTEAKGGGPTAEGREP